MSPDTKAKISAALKKAHAERAKKGASWKSASRHKKAGASTKANPGEVRSMMIKLEYEIAVRQKLLNALKEWSTK